MTPDKKNIAVYDNNTSKVVYYDLNGNFVRNKATGTYFLKMEYIDDNNIVINTYGIGKDDPALADFENTNNMVYLTDGDFKN